MILYLYSILFYVLAALDITEVQLGSSGQVCDETCLSCRTNIYECLQCKQGYFLFTLPSPHTGMKLPANARVCVQCPGTLNNNNILIKCSECLVNSMNWEYNRKCYTDYTDTSQTGTGTMVKEGLFATLYHVIASDGTQASQKFYKPQLCEGCSQFCKEASQICFPVADSFASDKTYPYISCIERYYYDEGTRGCQPCPLNCITCKAETKREQIGTTNQIRITTTTSCLVCQVGFALFKGPKYYTSVSQAGPAQVIETRCDPCPDNCSICFYGNTSTNFSDNHFKDIEHIDDVWSGVQAYLELKYDIALRCQKCITSPFGQYIPSLDQKSCFPCNNKCSDCEFVSYDSSVTNTPQQYLTRNGLYVHADKFDLYQMRCIRCNQQLQTFKLDGTDCEICPLNCRVCKQRNINDPTQHTLIPNFTPIILPLSQLDEQCVLCNEGYTLNLYKTCENITPITPTNCNTFQQVDATTYTCVVCSSDHILQQNGTCVLSCKAALNDDKCSNCLNKNGIVICSGCLDGYFVHPFTNLCTLCSSNRTCQKCYVYSQDCVHSPFYKDNLCPPDKYPQGPVCTKCPVGTELYQNQCEMCGEACLTCVTQTKNPYCSACKDGSQNLSADNRNCIACPSDCLVCSEPQTPDPNFNPQHQSNVVNSMVCQACKVGSYLDTRLNKCVRCTKYPYCNKIFTVTIRIPQDLDINKQFFQNSKEKEATILFDQFENEAVYKELNNNAVSTFILNLEFQYDAVNLQKNQVIFDKVAYITTKLPSNVATIRNLELNIKSTGAPNCNSVQWFLKGKVIIEYFNKINIECIEIMQLKDYYLLKHSVQVIQDQAFGFIIQKNEGAYLTLKNLSIKNEKGRINYVSNKYTTPQAAIMEKKFSAFVTELWNIINLNIINCSFTSMNYDVDPDLVSQTLLFHMRFTENVRLPEFIVNLENIQFQDLVFEQQSLITIQTINMTSALQDNTKINAKNILFKDIYFGNDTAVFTQKTTQKTGQIVLKDIQFRKVEFQQSLGLLNFNTLQLATIDNLFVYDSIINTTAFMSSNTLVVNNALLQNTKIQRGSSWFVSQDKSPQVSCVFGNECLELNLKFTDVSFLQNTCQEPKCLFSIETPENLFNILVDVSITRLTIQDTGSQDFNQNIINQAISAIFYVDNIGKFIMNDFKAVNNPKLSIFYINQADTIQITKLTSSQNTNDTISYVIFIDNYNKDVSLKDFELKHLRTGNNSLVAILSWKTEILTRKETLLLENILVENCTTTQVDSKVNQAPILIKSFQAQTITLYNITFKDNVQTTLSLETASTSCPSILINSPFSIVDISNCQWYNNTAIGGGSAVMMLVQSLSIKQIKMELSNYVENLQNITSKALGGHLYCEANKIVIYDAQFIKSTSKQGGAIYILTKNLNAIVNMDYIIIKQSYISLKQNDVSFGGAIFVNSQSTDLNLQINTLTIDQCYTGTEGTIQILPSHLQVQILLTNIQVIQAYGLGGQFLKVEFSDQSNNTQSVLLNNIYIEQSKEGFIKFMNSVGILNQQQQNTILKSAHIDIQNGNITLKYVTLNQSTNAGLLNAIKVKYIKLSYLYITDSTLVAVPFIKISDPQLFGKSFIELTGIKVQTINSINSNQTMLPQYIEIMKAVNNTLNKRNLASVLLLEGINSQNTLDLTNITMSNIICSLCDIGLLSISKFNDLISSPVVNIKDLQCGQCTTGMFGCITFTKLDIDNLKYQLDGTQTYITITNNINNTNSIPSANRIVQQVNTSTSTQTSWDPEKSQIKMIDVKIINITCSHYGCGIYDYNLNLNINNFECLKNTAGKKGGCIYLMAPPPINNKPQVQLIFGSRIIISNCNAESGGGIATPYYMTSNLNNTSEQNNTQNLNNTSDLNNTSNLNNTQNLNNTSDLNNVTSKNKNVTIKDNKATKNGNNTDQGANGLRLVINKTNIEQSQTNLTKSLNAYLSKQTIDSYSGLELQYKSTIELQFVDFYGQLYDYQDDSVIHLQVVNNTECYVNPSELKFNPILHGFNFSSVSLLCNSYADVQPQMIEITQSNIYLPVFNTSSPYQIIELLQDYKLFVMIARKGCPLGYVFANKACVYCEKGTYSLVEASNAEECQIQKLEMMESKGNMINLKMGYYRLLQSDDIKQCPKIIGCTDDCDICMGGYDVGNKLCRTGYVGALCMACDYDASYWPQKYCSKEHQCVPCVTDEFQEELFWDMTNGLIISYGVIIFILVFCTFQYDLAMRKSLFSRVHNILQLSQSQPVQLTSSCILKIYIFNIQLLSCVQFMDQLDYSQQTINYLNILNPVLLLQYSSQQYLPEYDNIIELTATNILLITVFSLVSIFISVILLLLLHASVHRTYWQWNKFYSYLVSTSILTILIVFPSILYLSIQIWQTYIIYGQKLLKHMITSNYEDIYSVGTVIATWSAFVATLAAIIYLYGLSYKGKAGATNNQITNEFIFGLSQCEFRKSRFWWGVLRLFILYIVLSLFNIVDAFTSDALENAQAQNSDARKAILLIVIIVYQLILFKYSPYLYRLAHYYDVFISILTFIALSAVIYYPNAQTWFFYWVIIVTISLITLVIIVLALFGYNQIIVSEVLRYEGISIKCICGIRQDGYVNRLPIQVMVQGLINIP